MKIKDCTECGRPLFDQQKCLEKPLCDECYEIQLSDSQASTLYYEDVDPNMRAGGKM